MNCTALEVYCVILVLSLGTGFFPDGVVFQYRDVNTEGLLHSMMNQIFSYCHYMWFIAYKYGVSDERPHSFNSCR